MRWLTQLFTRGRRYDEISESIRGHLEEKIADLMDDGMSRREAETAARREFGNVTRIEERSREVWQWARVEAILRDFRYGFRRLRRAPGFTVTALLTLGLGIGASIAVYSLVDAVLLRPLQFGNGKRLVEIFAEVPQIGMTKGTPAPANYFDWKRRNHVFADMAAAVGDIYTITGNGRPLEIEGTQITANLLPVLGVQPILGRNFTKEEDQPGNAVALISAGLWQQRYGSNPHILGKTIPLDGVPYRIIGVMPFGFTFTEHSDVWVPLALSAAAQLDRNHHYLTVYGLLRPGVTIPAAQKDMTDISSQLADEYPASNRGLMSSVVPLRDQLLGKSRMAIFVLACGVGILLLITCANVAGLMIARAANRQRESAIRVALGASRRELWRQGLAESLLLAVSGSILGIAFALLSMPIMRHFVPETMASWAHPEINWTVLSFTALVGAVTAIAFSLFGRGSAAARPQEALRNGDRGATDTRQRLRSVLVIGEIALTTIVLTSTGLLAGAFWKLAHTYVGFNSDSVLTMRTQLPVSAQTRYRDFSARVSFYQRVLYKVEHLPGVQAAGYTTFLPFTNPGGAGLILVKGAAPLPAGQQNLNYIAEREITPHYFDALSIPLLNGRVFSEADAGNTIPLAVISEKMAKQYWPHSDATGQQFRFDAPGTPWITVIGIVGDVHETNAETRSRPAMYFLYDQSSLYAQSSGTALNLPGYLMPRDLAIRVAGDPFSYAGIVKQAIWSVDPEQPISDIQSMRHIVNARMETYGLEAQLFTFFSIAALLVSALGIYGLMSYSVTQRTQEIGIRMALGAQRGHVLVSFLLAALRLFFAGLVLGIAGSVWATRLLGSLLYGISGTGWAIGAVPLLLLALCMTVAAWLPARRAAMVSPMRALHTE
ncbi:MAG TPA: ABC transporter permease [Acidobacteriaceae bacterium]|jgi:putative ABC transport system permease protein|nr:ABC transporter permease [Acidobacteriaceae bacterium]